MERNNLLLIINNKNYSYSPVACIKAHKFRIFLIYVKKKRKKNGAKIKSKCFFFVACAVLAYAWITPLRAVHKLTLLRGGEKLKITTYSQLAQKTSFTVDLDHVSFSKARNHAANTLSMKVKDHWLYYSLDIQSGKFHNPRLFDYVVGLQRKI